MTIVSLWPGKRDTSWSPIPPCEIRSSLTDFGLRVVMRRGDCRMIRLVQMRLSEQRQNTISESRHRRPACREEGRGNRETRGARDSQSMQDGGNDGLLICEFRADLCDAGSRIQISSLLLTVISDGDVCQEVESAAEAHFVVCAGRELDDKLQLLNWRGPLPRLKNAPPHG